MSEADPLSDARALLAQHDNPPTQQLSRAYGESLLGLKYTVITGEPFVCVVDGVRVTVPVGRSAEHLPDVPDLPKGGWNERYTAHVGRALIDRFPHLRDEAETLRTVAIPPAPVTVDHLRAALAEVDRLTAGQRKAREEGRRAGLEEAAAQCVRNANEVVTVPDAWAACRACTDSIRVLAGAACYDALPLLTDEVSDADR